MVHGNTITCKLAEVWKMKFTEFYRSMENADVLAIYHYENVVAKNMLSKFGCNKYL